MFQQTFYCAQKRQLASHMLLLECSPHRMLQILLNRRRYCVGMLERQGATETVLLPLHGYAVAWMSKKALGKGPADALT